MIERIAADTLATAERVATTTAVKLELGPETREVLSHIFESREGETTAREKIGGLIGKATS